MMTEELATVKIHKFDPVVDKEPRYEIYEVPYQGRTVMEVLNYIFENHDPDLSFRTGCKMGACGCCPVLLNEHPVFPCQKEAEPQMTVGPHPKFVVIKDLVVDFDQPK